MPIHLLPLSSLDTDATQGLVTAIGSIRAKDGKTPKEVLEFLLDLLENGDNSLNDVRFPVC